MSNTNRVKRQITKKFKRLGLSLKKDALKKVLELYDECDSNHIEFNQVLEELGELTLSQKLSTPIISLTQIQPVINQILDQSNPDHDTNEDNLLCLQSAFDARHFRYKRVGKQFVELESNGDLHGKANDLSSAFVDRYEMLLQRTLNHRIFRSSTLKNKDKNDANRHKLINTQQLIGTTETKCVFGMLCELKEGTVWLQDTHGAIQIDVTNLAKQTLGLFTFHCFVLCEGVMNNKRDIFEVETIGFPPYELRKKTVKTFNNLNFLPFDKQQIMMELEQKSRDDMFVFLNDIYLDENETFNKLMAVFDGYAAQDVAPTLFIFLGNFTRKQCDLRTFAGLFDKFADLLVNKYGETLCKTSDFIFVCGPNDQPIGNVLPLPPLLKSLRKKFDFYQENDQIAVHFQSNPFRIRFGTQEIVCFKQNLLQKMKRNCVIVPDFTTDKELTDHLTKTILDQSNLNPLPLEISPIYWNYAHALNLYPAPHLIVLGDTNEEYKWKYEDSQVCCPGNFTDTGRFIAYTPCTKEVDYCQI
eukprot:53374_1